MEYEYRKLSEEKAREIDTKDFVDKLGKKISINSSYSVTNKDETVVFQQTWHSHEKEEPDRYFLAYKKYYFSIDIFSRLKSEKRENSKDYYFTYDISQIFTKACEAEDYQLEDLLKVLKDVILGLHKYTLGRTNPGDRFFAEVMYGGEVI